MRSGHGGERAALGVLVGFAALSTALWPATAYADSLVSSQNPSVVGDQVTFTYTFSITCADGAQVEFKVDGQSYAPTTVQNPTGIQITATLTLAFSAAGDHTVVATYTALPPNPGSPCSGSAALVQTVSPAPPAPPPQSSPTPTVAPEPSPSESPSQLESSPSPSASPTPASGARISLASTGSSSSLQGGLLAIGAVALAIAALASYRDSRLRRRT